MGARVTGIDLSSASVELARSHASLDPIIAKNVTYQAISTDQLAEQGDLQGVDTDSSAFLCNRSSFNDKPEHCDDLDR